MALLHDGNPHAAIDALTTLVEEFPKHSLAPHAFVQIGKINETHLGNYENAIKAYSQVVERFPNSSAVRRARVRLGKLTESRGSGDVPLRIYRAVLQDYRSLGSDEALRRMEDLAENFPEFVHHEQALLWIGEEHLRRDEFDIATQWFDKLRAQYPGSKTALLATMRIGVTQLEARNFDEAEKAFLALAQYQSVEPRAARLGASYIKTINLFRTWQHIYWLALAICVAALVGWFAGTKWRLVTWPVVCGAVIDVAVFSVVGATCAALVARKHPVYWRDVALAGFALAVATVLSHLFIATNALPRPAKLVLAVLVMTAGAGFVYAIYYQTDLVNTLYHSMREEIAAMG